MSADALKDTLIQSIGRVEAFLATVPNTHPKRLGVLEGLGLALQLRFERTGSRADLDRSISIVEEVISTSPSNDPQRHERFWTLALAKKKRFERTDAVQDIDGVISAMDDAIRSTAVDHSDRPDRLIRLGEALLDRYKKTESKQDLDRAITVQEDALPLLPIDHSERSCCLDMLGNAYDTRFSVNSKTTDLDRAIALKEQAVSSLAANTPDRSRYLTNLFNALRRRYEVSESFKDLDRSIVIIKEAVDITPVGNPLRERRLLCFSSSLSTRYKLTGSTGDIDTAIQAARNANELALRDTRLPLGLNTLALALSLRFERAGSLNDSDEAIRILRNKLASADSQDGCDLNNLGCILLRRFERFGSPEDVDLAVKALVSAIDPTPPTDPDRIGRLNNLVLAYQYRFECVGAVDDLEYAVRKCEEGMSATLPQHPDRATILMNLGNVLRLRFTQNHSPEDINRSIEMLGEAIGLIQDDRMNRSLRAKLLLHLGDSHETLFSQNGSFDHLSQAISMKESALDMMSEDHPDLPAALDRLSSAYVSRFTQTGSSKDLSTAITLLERAVEAIPANHPNRLRFLTSLSVALQYRFAATESLDDITRAITIAEDVLKVTPKDALEQAFRFNNLGGGFLSRYQKTGSLDDLDQAIKITEDALKQQSTDMLHSLSNLNNLSLGLRYRYEHTKSITDLDRAIELAQESVEGAPVDYPKNALFLNTLSHSLLTRFEETGKQEDLNQAISAAEDAINLISISPTTRIDDAFQIANRIADRDPRHAARLYRLAVELLPTVSPRTINPIDQQNNLSKFAGRPGLAAAFALEQGASAFEALSLLEIGRGVLANMQLELRSDFSGLQKEHPVLAKKFLGLRDRLDSSDHSMNRIADPNKRSLRYSRAVEFEALIKEIRSLKGFERFLLGPTESELIDLASSGPIIVLNASDRRCDAFTISSTGISVISLPKLKYPEDVLEQANALQEVMNNTSVRGYSASMKKLRRCLEWLWDVAVGPILDELGFKDTPHDLKSWQRVWWMPTGLLSVFPWHAAGRHAPGSSRSAIDRVVSSYTPTLKALSYMREKARNTSPVDHQRAVLVAMSTTEDQKELPSADVEVQGIFDLLPTSISKSILHKPAKKEVLAEIRKSNIVHFACHGESSRFEPSQSRLFLRDWKKNPLSVADLIALRLDNTRFAYLSSCHAAGNQSLLLEESMHLAGACYMAGFTDIVGTLWHIYDTQSANIAVEVYSFMLDHEGRLDLVKSAEGLHHALRRLRDQTREVPGVQKKQPDDPIVWAAYIHMGV
jgi:tetratricopeptide (TPR) repeat protein